MVPPPWHQVTVPEKKLDDVGGTRFYPESSKCQWYVWWLKYVWRGLCRFSCWDSTDINLHYHSALDTALVRIRAHQPYTWAGLELAFSAGWEAAKLLAIATDINGQIESCTLEAFCFLHSVIIRRRFSWDNNCSLNLRTPQNPLKSSQIHQRFNIYSTSSQHLFHIFNICGSTDLNHLNHQDRRPSGSPWEHCADVWSAGEDIPLLIPIVGAHGPP